MAPQHVGRAVDFDDLIVVAVPLAERNAAVEVVGAYEDNYRVHFLSVPGLQLLGLADYLVHLVAADAVDIRLYAQNVPEVVPVDVVGRAYLTRVGNRISEERHPGALPLAPDLRLGGRQLQGREKRGAN